MLVLPVNGLGVSLGFAAKHHISVVLSRFEGKHHTAGLFGEHGSQQDCTSWVENQQKDVSFDVLPFSICYKEWITKEGRKHERAAGEAVSYKIYGSFGHMSKAHEHVLY